MVIESILGKACAIALDLLLSCPELILRTRDCSRNYCLCTALEASGICRLTPVPMLDMVELPA